MTDSSAVRAEKDPNEASSDDRLELFRATLRELEKTEGTRRNHTAITHLKWLISKQIATPKAAPAPGSNSSFAAGASLIEKQ